MLRLPVVFEALVTVEHGIEAEIHRAHVEGGHLRAGAQGRGQPLLQAHPGAAAGGDVDHGIAALLDPGQELHEDLGIGGRLAVLGIAGMKMDDRGSSLRGGNGLLGDLPRGDRQMGRHRWRMDRAGDGAGDDHLAVLGGHDFLP